MLFRSLAAGEGGADAGSSLLGERGSFRSVSLSHRPSTLPRQRYSHASSSRCGRFTITATTGLVAGLLSPFAAFLRTPTLTAIGGVLLFGFITFIVLTFQGMMSPPTPVIGSHV